MDDVKTEESGSLAVAPRPPHPEDNWLEFIGAGVAAGFTNAVGADVYNDVKAACRAAVEKFRDQQSDPDGETLWMHQLVAERSMGPCPPGRKLVHLNGDGLDNRRANLAYVPESDPRPAAPLNPRLAGRFTEIAATSKTTKAVATGKKRRKGKRKRRLQIPVVTTIIAIYGSVLSTASAALGAWYFLRSGCPFTGSRELVSADGGQWR